MLIHSGSCVAAGAAAVLATAALAAAAAVPGGASASPSTPRVSSAVCQPHPGRFCLPPRDGLGLGQQLVGLAERGKSDRGSAVPWTPTECAEHTGHRCYTARHVQRAYGLDRLHQRGITGEGEEIAFVMPLGNRDLQRDLDAFSDANGLPRTTVEVHRLGDVPDADPTDVDQAVNLSELALDVESAHAAAPGARITVVSTPVNILQGPAGWQEAAEAVDWLTGHRTPTVISFSYGIYERNLHRPGQPNDPGLLRGWRRSLERAALAGTTVVAAAGDTGPTGPDLTGRLHPARTVPWPAADPLVTGVTGTTLHLDDAGNRVHDDELWTAQGSPYAGGAGYSRIFPGSRSADVAMAASPANRMWFYSSVSTLPGQTPGWQRAAGTSLGAPWFAGTVALAAQRNGAHLGPLTRTLARIHPGEDGTQDLVDGCNTANGVVGFCAHPGPDAASGIGTVRDADAFTAALARLSR
ncbi:S53 family peptidase [Streptomyces sp. B1866]|uniref:S53 family peptidase n=1 Tax=Streptomyces sp. B1866 TaxID=3075431 RepID=UPI0028908EA5|nr:S53 family peptidase [Streptomyces sp. B1866]MDT3395238.1 S53 family peptidase [Streptomyces sp. B1866]